MATLIDSNIVISLLIESEKTDDAQKILWKIEKPVTIISVMEESIYVGLALIYGARGSKLKKEMSGGLNDESISFLRNLNSFLKEFGIRLINPPNDVKLLDEIIEEYSLLPNDALIAATCKFYGIERIATFDEDFERVNFLEVVRI